MLHLLNAAGHLRTSAASEAWNGLPFALGPSECWIGGFNEREWQINGRRRKAEIVREIDRQTDRH